MIRRLSEIPAIGTTMQDIDDPDMPILKCIMHLTDQQDADTVYAVMASIEDSLNIYEEFGVKYNRLIGFTDLHDGR